MNIFVNIFLWSLESLTSLDKLPWLLGLPLLAVALLLFFKLIQSTRKLQYELTQLAKVKHHPVEYELVLKTMKLSIWHIDVATHTFTYDSDFRENGNNVVLSQGAPYEDYIAQMEPSYAENFRKALEDLMENRRENMHEQYQMKIPFSDKTYWGETYATVDKRNIDGKPLSIVGTSLRIDHQKETENALVEALYRAEESDRLKSAFLANMSHEIRTPLNAIIGFSDVLPMVQSEKERNDIIKLIKKNNATLLRLFDDMVRMAKLEAKAGEAQKKTTFELTTLFTEIAEKYATDSEESSVMIRIDGAPLTINCDRDRLTEIINQYVNNAMKFTAEGSVTMGYTVTGSLVRIWVRDTGKGIPKEKCTPHLFDNFVKLDDFVQGTGLGLSICRNLATNMDGKVGVESEEGKGSCFWVEIPME